MAVFIVGMYRSGGSIVADILDAFGVSFETPNDLVADTERSRPGQDFGNRRLAEMNRAFAGANDLSTLTLPAFARRSNPRGSAEYKEAVESFANAMSDVTPWGTLDSDLSFHLPCWRQAVPGASAVICVRRPETVAALLRQDDIPLVHGAALWELYTIAALENSRRMPRIVLVYEEMIADPEAAVRKLVAGLPDLNEVDLTDEVLKLAASRVLPDPDEADVEAQPELLNGGQAHLYKLLAAGKLSLAPRRGDLLASEQLIDFAASAEGARAEVERTVAQLRGCSEDLDRTRRDHARFLARAVDIVAPASGDPSAQPSEGELLRRLRWLAKKASEPPEGYVAAASVTEMTALRDERIDWYKSEAEAWSGRMNGTLDELKDARLSAIELSAKVKELELTLNEAKRERDAGSVQAPAISSKNARRTDQPLPSDQNVDAEVARLKAELNALRQDLKATRAALANANQVTASLEGKITALKAQQRSGEPSPATLASVSGKQAAANPMSMAETDRLRRQLMAMSQLISDIDGFLNPRFGGRFWIPVRNIRLKIVQVRDILNAEMTHAKKRLSATQK